MPPTQRTKQAGARRAPPRAARSKNNQSQPQPEKPRASLEARRAVQGQKKKAVEAPSSQSRIFTRSQARRAAQEASADHGAPAKDSQLRLELGRRDGERRLLPPRSQRNSAARLSQRLYPWLYDLEPALGDGVGSSRQGNSYSEDHPEGDMESSSSISGASRIFSDATSTTRAPRRDPKRELFEKLRTRRASPGKPTPEEKTDEFKAAFGLQGPITIPFKDTKGLQAIMNKFVQKALKAKPSENSYAAIEEVSNEINHWKSTFRLATITNQDFISDVKNCIDSNEAVLQRTVMISIIDRWRLSGDFGFNCEGWWTLQGKHFPLPSTQGPQDKVSGPKPDLAIFFNFDSFIGTDPLSEAAPIPPDLKTCMRPDDSETRCFPFMFIEAKRGYHDLTLAVYANMHSASQALLNIYAWMERAGHEDIFFNDVRLFSIAINAEKAIVRVHRAESLGEHGLRYLFDELCEIKTSERDEICVLIRNIILQYGAGKLRGILRAAFKEVSGEYERSLRQNIELQKRRSEAPYGAPAKKSRTHRGIGRQTNQSPADVSSSFGASGISLEDR